MYYLVVVEPGKQIFIIHRIMGTDFISFIATVMIIKNVQKTLSVFLIAWNSFSHFFSDNINWVLNLIHDIFLLPLEVIL